MLGPIAPLAPVAPPAATAPPANVGPTPSQLARWEQLAARLNELWQSLSAKVDALAKIVADAEQAAGKAAGSSGGAPTTQSNAPTAPPDVAVDAIEKAAEPWISAKLSALLVSFGVPSGVAGVAAGAVVWFLMRRGKARLESELERLKGTSATTSAPTAPMPAPTLTSTSTPAPTGGASSPDPAVVERHFNQYVPYEASAIDKAWAAAHAHIGEKYPGAVPYLKMIEGVKDQLLSGSNDSSHS